MEWDANVSAYLITKTERFYVHVAPMIFNHRILLTPESEYPYGWEGGWCYPDKDSAVAAAQAWDPETQLRPEGFAKEAAPRLSSLRG